MASITLEGIGKTYPGDVPAVKDFNLVIEDKEFVVLVGPSGCGKSTTLRMIAGLEESTQGQLSIGEKVVNGVPPKQRNIAMVFQNYALYPHMSVYQNMAFALELCKTPKAEIEASVSQTAQALGIEHLLQRRPKALSGGERQRVALGRAMVRHPAVFLLDEPLSNLDAKLRASMRVELIKLHKRLATTFVYVTHDQTEAMTMGDRIVVMDKGVIQQADTPQKLYDEPCNMFVASFIGSPQMNFMDGVIEKQNNQYCFSIGNDRLPIPEKMKTRLAPYEGQAVKMGVRPENLMDDASVCADSPEQCIAAAVEVCEKTGSDAYLYLDYHQTRLTARVAPSTLAKPGSQIFIAVDMEKAHFFDTETHLAI